MPKFAALGQQPFIQPTILCERAGAEARCPYRDSLDKIGDRSMLREHEEPSNPITQADEVAFIRQHARVDLWLDFGVCTRQAKAPGGEALHHRGGKPGLVEATFPKTIPVGVRKQHHIVAA
jgi:hypothetical protein